MAEVYKHAGIMAAQIAGEDPEMDRVANEIARRARANANRNRDSGTFADSIEVQRVRGRRGVMDRIVVATDPLAAVKELGHTVRREKGGPALGFVPGQHALGRAAQSMPEVTGD